MREAIGEDFYNFTQFINKNTPESATVLIPPRGFPWPQTGNVGYIRYFIYPREIAKGKEYEPAHDYESKRIDYVLIAWGETPTTSHGFTHGWPKFDVEAEYILYLNKDGGVTKKPGNYVYDEHKNNKYWGLIKINN
jgi:hypothetical protein